MKEKKISKENEKAEQPASSNEFEVENEETVANEREEMIRVKELEDELSKLNSQNSELNDKYLRLAAEYDNFKKRTAKEKEDLLLAAKANVLKSLLPVFDNLDRAKDCMEDHEKLAEGVKMILKQFDTSLEALGISEVKALGEVFDPEFCEAVFHEEVEGEPENTVSQVLLKGYVCDGKVIRHAMVKVVN
jgi:molecular chaperone GrpE